MTSAVISADPLPIQSPGDDAPILGLVSAVICAAAGGLVASSLLRNGRKHVAGQVCLGALTGCAAAITLVKRREEAEAARHLAHHIHEVRDKRWLKRHPINYG